MKEEFEKQQHKQQRSSGEGREAVPLTPTSITPNGKLDMHNTMYYVDK